MKSSPLTREGTIGAEDLAPCVSRPEDGDHFPPALLRRHSLRSLQASLEKRYLIQLLVDRGGNIDAVACVLGIKTRALYRRFRRLGIRPQDVR